MSTTAPEPALSSLEDPATPRKKKPLVRAVQISISVAVAIVIFALILPKIASYSSVWRTITELTWLEMVTLVLAATFNLTTYWVQMVAAMPGLSLSKAAINNQSSTTIANVMPGGGAIAIGVAYAMFRSWGYTGTEIALMMSTTGIWNSFLKLFLPILALALLAASGKATTALLVPAVIGLAIMIGSLTLFALSLWQKRFARAIGDWVGDRYSSVRRLLRKPSVSGFGERAVAFRRQTLNLVGKRWLSLTLTTIVSHLGLYFVLLLALRHLGVREEEVSWIQVLAVFAFARLLSAAPITPGGVGIVELALIGGLYAAGRGSADVALPVFRAQVIAAALLFRTLTYGVQIPLGGLTYLIWQRKRSWRQPLRVVDAPVAVGEGVR